MKKIFFVVILSTITVQLQAQNTTALNGTFFAPSGTKIILQNNNTDDLALTAKKDTGKIYSRNPFSFTKKLAAGANYNVTVKSIPVGMSCKITNGYNVMPSTGVKIECDNSYDLISRSTKDSTLSTFYECTSPVVAGPLTYEGRYVAFVSYGAGFCGTTGKYRQIFWRDRNTGITKLVSLNVNGEEGNGNSFAPSMSVDGHTVAFESYATNLVEGDANGVRDIFVWDFFTGKVQRVSVGAGNVEANAQSFQPSVMAGEIAYVSNASNLTGGVDGTSTTNVYWSNLTTGEQKLISIDPKTGKGVGGSNPSINMDGGGGTKIAFCSYASSLVADDNNGLWDIFVWNPYKPLKRVSLTSTGGERNQGTESSSRDVAPSISGNGRYVAFATTATNMVPNDNNNAQDVFVVDTETGAVVRASVNINGKEGDADSPIGQGEKIAINYDGTWTAFTTRATTLGVPEFNIVMHNGITGETRTVSKVTGSQVGVPVLSLKANYVIFGMGSPLDARFKSSGIFAAFTAISGSRFNY